MLTPDEQLRYSRQIMLKKVGEQGQLALKNAKVLIVGAGGLGNPVAMYLASAGVGHIIIADGDQVEITNLQRQILFGQQDIGVNKADTAMEKLTENNNEITVEAVDEMLDEELAQYYISEVDLVIDCTDNITTRYLLNRLCVSDNKPLVVGAATGFDGQQMVVDPRDKNSACYQCLFPVSKKAPANNCQTIGILGPILSIIGGVQALEAIKLLTNNQVTLSQLHLFDGLSNQWQKFKVKKQASCPVCNN